MLKSPEMEAALAACESEPIHIPGAIQDFGVLLCLDQNLQHLRQVSNNVANLLNLSAEACLAATGAQLLGQRLIDQLRGTLRDRSKTDAFLATLDLGSERRDVYVSAYRTGGGVVVELEPVEVEGADASLNSRRLPAMHEWLNVITHSHSPLELLNNLVGAVASLTGYDRVLVYRFDESFNGEVVAESRADSLAPLLGHHFPAHDIPAQVRAMYQYNPVRIIADSGAASVPLIPQRNPDTGEPLDLRLGALRAVSPVHQQYLRNMGVGSAVSIAIFSSTGLWGIVSCHNQSPKPMPLSVRESAATLTQVASQRLFLLYARAEGRYRAAVQSHRERFIEHISRMAPGEFLRDQAAGWLELLNACGLAFSHGDWLLLEGKTPEPENIRALTDWLGAQTTGLAPWSSNSLIDSGYEGFVDMSCGCGVLAMPLVTEFATNGWLLFFRPEKKRVIEWGGKPEGVIVDAGDQPRLSPRASFTTWQEVVHGTSEPWLAAEQLAIRDLGTDLMVAISTHEITRLNQDLRKEQKALAEANERLRHLALTDALTGTGNRQKTENEIDSALNSAHRYGTVFSLLLFDIDHFKEVNDTYGHNMGDRVLKQMAESVSERLRESDTLGRWGGEEFVVLMPNTDIAGAQLLAERLLQQLATEDFGLNQQVTVSIGVTQWRPGDDRARLIGRADAAMYAAKQKGRNRVCLSENG